MGFSANKLRVNLKLVINRLKLLEKKKTEIAQKSRKEIADYLVQSKDDRARIRVEHIIREDYLVEAMEMLELYADLLLARFGLIETIKYCEEGLIEAVATLIWAAPRLQSEVNELKVVADQLGQKYGKPFHQEASSNVNKTVNERLINKLSPKAPPKVLVERYLIEIARSHNVAFEPDPSVMENDLSDIDSKGVDGDDDSNFNGSSGFGSNGGGSNTGGGGGNTRSQIGFEPYNSGNPVPPLPQMPSIPGQNVHMAYPPPQVNAPYPPHSQVTLPPPTQPGYPSNPEVNAPYPPHSQVTLPPPTQPGYPSNPEKFDPRPGYHPGHNSQPPPSINFANPPYPVPTNGPSAPPKTAINNLPNVPDLPDVPSDSLPGNASTVGGASGGDDLDFDDLNRRFEELKKKK